MLLSCFRNRAVDWDVLTISPSEIDRRSWLKIEKFEGPVSAGGASNGPLLRAFIPDVGTRVVYFGAGHRAAIATANVQVKRAISAYKKSLDSRRRRERERLERERERELERIREAKIMAEKAAKGEPVEEFVSEFLPDEDVADNDDDDLGPDDDIDLDEEGQPKKKKKPASKLPKLKATPKKSSKKAAGSAKKGQAVAAAEPDAVDFDDAAGADFEDDDEFAADDGLSSLKPTAWELLVRSKPRDGAAKCDVVDVSYHTDRNGDPYCRVKLRVVEWFAGADNAAPRQPRDSASHSTTVRLPSLCVMKDNCTICGDGGDLLKVCAGPCGNGCCGGL